MPASLIGGRLARYNPAMPLYRVAITLLAEPEPDYLGVAPPREARGYVAIGTDVFAEFENLFPAVHKGFPKSIVIAGQLVFRRETWGCFYTTRPPSLWSGVCNEMESP